MIEIDGLTKRYGDKTAVDGLSFVVEPGVVTGFLGPNGAGKPNIGIRHFFVRVPRSSAWTWRLCVGGGKAELGEDRGGVLADCALAAGKPSRDRRVGQALSHQRENRSFTLSARGERIRSPRAGPAVSRRQPGRALCRHFATRFSPSVNWPMSRTLIARPGGW